MTATTDISTQENCRGQKVIYRSAASAPVYGMGLIGAMIYYLSNAATFWIGVLGVFKAIFWPAFLVYELLKYLNI